MERATWATLSPQRVERAHPMQLQRVPPRWGAGNLRRSCCRCRRFLSRIPFVVLAVVVVDVAPVPRIPFVVLGVAVIVCGGCHVYFVFYGRRDAASPVNNGKCHSWREGLGGAQADLAVAIDADVGETEPVVRAELVADLHNEVLDFVRPGRCVTVLGRTVFFCKRDLGGAWALTGPETTHKRKS